MAQGEESDQERAEVLYTGSAKENLGKWWSRGRLEWVAVYRALRTLEGKSVKKAAGLAAGVVP
jgi:hypothetical protein